MSRHYLQLVFPVTEHTLRREYFELLSPDETEEEALARWVASHPSMVERVRNRERQERVLRESVLYTTLCRPSSWYRELAEKEGRPYPSPAVSSGTRGKVRRGR